MDGHFFLKPSTLNRRLVCRCLFNCTMESQSIKNCSDLDTSAPFENMSANSCQLYSIYTGIDLIHLSY